MRRLIAVLACAAALAACTGQPDDQVPAATATTSSPSPTPTPSPEPTTSPLSGREGGVDTPVIVVKVDNTRPAQPHRGLPSADIVYVEPVEWGLTRLAAVFSTDVPTVVGPVRSARIGDLSMLAPYGSIAFAFSGAQQKLWPRLKASDFILFSEDLGSPGFTRERGRYAPVNLMANPKAMLKSAGTDVATSKDMGLTFDDARPEGGSRARNVTARWPYSTVQFRWNSKAGAYDVWLNGSRSRDVDPPYVERATSVIVQYVKEVDSGYGDKFGGRTPLPIQTGSGKGLVLRNGRAYKIEWSRTSAAQSTTYTRTDGSPIALDPGQVWIVLMDKTRKVTIVK